jgi:phosphoenolpyruvate synthase/pyruvate phosphate dikinase
MNWILSPEEIDSEDRRRVGGKGYALSLLIKGGFNIPRTVCITSEMYQEFVLRTGLRERILLELHRRIKPWRLKCGGRRPSERSVDSGKFYLADFHHE